MNQGPYSLFVNWNIVFLHKKTQRSKIYTVFVIESSRWSKTLMTITQLVVSNELQNQISIDNIHSDKRVTLAKWYIFYLSIIIKEIII